MSDDGRAATGRNARPHLPPVEWQTLLVATAAHQTGSAEASYRIRSAKYGRSHGVRRATMSRTPRDEAASPAQAGKRTLPGHKGTVLRIGALHRAAEGAAVGAAKLPGPAALNYVVHGVRRVHHHDRRSWGSEAGPGSVSFLGYIDAVDLPLRPHSTLTSQSSRLTAHSHA